MLPIDILLVRHGQSEGNKVGSDSENGEKELFGPEFRDKHSRDFRLTDKGIRQAKAAGEWLKLNVPVLFDRFYVSDYIRAKETAGYLNLPNALWEEKIYLRERDLALMDNLSKDQKNKLFALENEQYERDRFLCYPAGGGESVAQLCWRLKTTQIEHWARECSEKRVIAVCHGHVMRAIQFEFENLGHDDFIRLDTSDKPEDKLRNCQILWYTRRNPETGEINPKLFAVRSICPLNSCTNLAEDFGWKRITHRRYTNEELLEEASRYQRHIK